jgi:uncharacterized membrane protein YgaE (UPF0421/DUF939 family)
MTVPSNFSAIRGIPLRHLFLALENVRKDDSEDGIPERKEAIQRRHCLSKTIAPVLAYQSTSVGFSRHKRFPSHEDVGPSHIFHGPTDVD